MHAQINLHDIVHPLTCNSRRFQIELLYRCGLDGIKEQHCDLIRFAKERLHAYITSASLVKWSICMSMSSYSPGGGVPRLNPPTEKGIGR